MIQTATLHFLKSLDANNNKPWFDEHRDKYTAAKKDFETLVDALLLSLSAMEPAFKEQKAKDCVFRIFRDVRFSKDKTPYKTHFGAYFSKGGKKFSGAGYYLHIEPGKSFAGGGLWMPEAALLKAVRQEIDYNFNEFAAIVESKQFKKIFGSVEGEQLKKLPQGYDAGNPAIEYLKLKSFTAGHEINDDEITGKNFVKNATSIFETMKPLVDFLNRSLE